MSHGHRCSAGTLTLKNKFRGKIILTEVDPQENYILRACFHQSVKFVGMEAPRFYKLGKNVLGVELS